MMEAGFHSLRACLEASEKQRMSPQTCGCFLLLQYKLS